MPVECIFLDRDGVVTTRLIPTPLPPEWFVGGDRPEFLMRITPAEVAAVSGTTPFVRRRYLLRRRVDLDGVPLRPVYHETDAC